MTPTQFRAALRTLDWSQARAARELGAANHQRISEWCRGTRPVPPYIAAHVHTHLARRESAGGTT